jgi:hypothetical protein
MADPNLHLSETPCRRGIADASPKVARSFYALPRMTDNVLSASFGTIDRAFRRGRSALKRCEIVQFLLGLTVNGRQHALDLTLA